MECSSRASRFSSRAARRFPRGTKSSGFDQVAPNEPKDISSWLYDRAIASSVDAIDNRAKAVPCYDPAYTFVEKLQTISTKFRRQQIDGSDPLGFMRHYYDVLRVARSA
jgi:hypothetical protein